MMCPSSDAIASVYALQRGHGGRACGGTGHAAGSKASGVTGAIKSHSFIIALNINKLSFSAQRWKSLVMRHMTKNCELDSKSEYLTPFSHSDHHHGSRGPLHESRKLSTIGPTESTFASADSRSDSLNM